MNADYRLLCISKDGIGLQYLWMGFREALASRSLPVGVAPMGQLPPGVGVRMAERSKAAVQVAVSPGGMGSNPTSDRPILWLRTAATDFSPLTRCPCRAVTLPKFFS